MAEQRLAAVESPGPLLPWLVAALRPVSRTKVKEWLQGGRVHVNGAPTTRHDHALRPGDRVTVGAAAPRVGRDALPVVYADAAVVVTDKPAGLLSVATDSEKEDTAFTRLSAARAARGEARPHVVHRLDRETSGLLLFATTAAFRDALQAAWESVEKRYLAVVEGRPPADQGLIDNHLREGKDLRVRPCDAQAEGAKRAVSRYEVVRARGPFTLVEVTLLTGRKHQIRAHLAGVGCPVVGDKSYGATHDPARRLGLHAWRLDAPHPDDGERIACESPLPEALQRVVGGSGSA